MLTQSSIKITMHPNDKSYTTFYTDNDDVLCYKVMPFRLVNTRATYQRMVNKLFKDMVG